MPLQNDLETDRVSFNLIPRTYNPIDQWLGKVSVFPTVGLGDADSGYQIEFAYNHYSSYLNARGISPLLVSYLIST